MESRKRKRDDESFQTVVTFSAPHNRTFDRVLRDQSFSEVKGLVRKKLGLSKDDHLGLVQLRDGREVDLEDEDDYEAFRALSRVTPSLQVLVRVGDARPGVPEGSASSPRSLHPTTGHSRNSQTAQPVAGPSTLTLDALVSVEQTTVVDTPPRKKQKADAVGVARAQSVAESVLTDASGKKRKKKHTTRVPSSGSAADLSTNLPESPAPASNSGKNPGPFVVDSTGPSRAVSPQPTPSDSPPPAKSKKKRKVDDKTIDAYSTLHVGAPEPVSASSKSKKRATAPVDPVEEPQPKKAKKKAKERPALVDAPTSSPPAQLPPHLAEDRPKKAKKKSKNVTEDSPSVGQQTAKPTIPVEPTSAVASSTGKGKKTAAFIETTTIPPVLDHETTQIGRSDALSKKKKGSKSAKADQPTAGPSSQDPLPSTSAKDKNIGAAGTQVNGSAEIAVEPPKSAKVRKDKPKSVVLDDTDFMAAVNAVLFKSSSKALESPSAAGTNAAAAMPTISSQPPQSKSKAKIESSKNPRKSRLSTTWGPADLTEERTSNPPAKTIPAVPVDDTSVSAALSSSRLSSVRRPPRPPATTESSVSAKTNVTAVPKLDASFSVSRATSPERPLSAIPAGSEISELVVQARDEGSSNESEDTDEDPAEEVIAPSAIPLLSRYAPSQPNSAGVSEVDVEALLRGPMPTRSVLSLIPSESSSEEERSESEALASEEEEKEDRAYRRMSKRFEAQASSSDEEPVEDEPADPETVELMPSPNAGSESSEEEAADEPVPVESSVPAAAEATNNEPLRTSPSTDVKSDEETKVPSEQAQSEKAPAELAESESEPEEELDGDAGTPESSSSRADMAEVENIVPTSDSVEAEDDAHDSGEIKVKEDGLDVQSTGDQELSQEVPFPEDFTAANGEKEVSVDAEENMDAVQEGPAVRESSEVETDFEQLAPGTPGLRSRSSSREDPADPIQPAEGLAIALDRASHDPIEFDPPVAESDEDAEVPMASPLPGTARRMKDRNGKVPASDALPALSSQLRVGRRTRSTRNSSNSVADDAGSVASPEPNEKAAPEPRRSARQASVQPQPAPAETLPPAPAPKRRGRPPASAEEKARKAAEKEAEKQRKAAEREAKKKKAAEEKALKAAAKGKKVPAKKAAASAKAASAEAVPAESSPTSPPAPAVPSQPALSVAKWTSLAETSQTQDVEMSSMVDELRSSSPELGSHDPITARAGTSGKGRNAEPVDVSMQQEEEDEDEKGTDDESPTVKVNSRARPLFIPSDSQYPPAEARSHLLSSPQAQPSQSQSQSQPSQVKFKRPLAPVTSWANQSKFRRLSDLASQEMFSPLTKLPIPGRRPQTAPTAQTAEERRASMYGDVAGSSSDDDSDSEDENVSHIPKNRRAGVHKKELFAE